MNKLRPQAQELLSIEPDSQSRERDDEPVVNEKVLHALREKVLFDAATSKYGQLDTFDLNSLRGLTLSKALIRYPKLLDIMDDVLVKVSGAVSDALGRRFSETEVAEQGHEFALLLKRFGMWFYRNGQFQKALKAFEGSLEFLGEDGEIYRVMGDIYSGMENYRDAITCYKQAFHLSPDHSGIVRRLADVNVKMAEVLFSSNPELSVRYYSDALGYVENYLPALCGLGEMAYMNKDFDAAHNYFEQALEVDPSSVRALNGFANVHAVHGDEDEAEYLFNEVLLMNPVYLPTLYDFASFNLRQKKNYRRAMIYVDRAQRLDSKDVSILLLKVEIAMEMGDFDTAERTVETVLELHPTNKAAFDYYCRLKNGDCFLPNQYSSSFRSVRQDRQATSRDQYFSLRYRLNPDDESLFEEYVIEVAKDQGDTFEQFRSPGEGKTVLN